jgi:ribonuclease D
MRTPTTPHTPDKDEIDTLPPFAALGMGQITVVNTAEGVQAVAPALLAQRVWGFDTESKPTFTCEQVSDGPHLVQLSAAGHAWLYQLGDRASLHAVAELLESPGHVLAGFGLGDDRKRLQRKLGVSPEGILELNQIFRQRGHRKEVGIKAAVAIVFGQRFAKSKKAATSNWANDRLSPSQILYAANDAWGAYRVAEALDV